MASPSFDTKLVAVITGGSTGIGEAMVHRFTREGARVVFCARNEDTGGAVERAGRSDPIAGSIGGDATFVQCAVTDETAVDAVLHAPQPRAVPGEAVPHAERAARSGGDQREEAPARAVRLERRVVELRAQARRQPGCGAHREDPCLRQVPVRTRGAISGRDHAPLRRRLQRRVDQQDPARLRRRVRLPPAPPLGNTQAAPS